MNGSRLSDDELQRLRAVAVALIPGDGTSPPADEVPDFERLLSDAGAALGIGISSLRRAMSRLPESIDWASLSRFAIEDQGAFREVTSVASGAYFMSPAVLASLGYPTGPRSAAPFDLAAEEISSGILEPVIAGGSRVRDPRRSRKDEA